jgi:hypothetical protein
MRRLRKFVALSPPERWLLFKAAFLLGVIKLGLRWLPFGTLLRLLSRVGEAPIGLPAPTPHSPDRIAWAVAVASSYLLRVRPCLVQALAVRLLLVRRGYPARLRLGVARGERGRVQAHAWVETDGGVVIGGSASELRRYTPLLAVDAGTA